MHVHCASRVVMVAASSLVDTSFVDTTVT